MVAFSVFEALVVLRAEDEKGKIDIRDFLHMHLVLIGLTERIG